MERSEGRYLLFLREAAQAVVSAPEPAAALAELVSLVAERLGYEVCSLYLHDRERDELVLEATHGLRPEAIGRVRMRPGEGLTGRVFAREEALFTARPQRHPQFKFFPETGEEGFRSYGGVPLQRGGERLGVLAVQTSAEHTFHAHEVVALEAVANHIVGLLALRERLERPRLPERPAARATGELLVGLGTSPGVGLGSAVLRGVDPLRSPPPRRPFSDVGSELARLERAQGEARARLEAEARVLEERGGGAAAGAVLRVHAAVLEDPELLGRVRARIEAGAPVESAVYAVFAEAADILRAAGPPAGERADDLLDVRTHLLSALGLGEDEALRAARGVLVAPALTPAEVARLDPDAVVAVVTEQGGETSHASLLARSLGIPAVVGVEGICARVAAGDRLLVDGDAGVVFLRPDPAVAREALRRDRSRRDREERVRTELATLPPGSGLAGVEVLATAGLPGELAAARAAGADGVGLVRTEFYYVLQPDWPSVEEQEAAYRAALDAAPAGPVVFRLLDAGGDKPLPFLPAPAEANPALGLRGVRLLLAHPERAREQLEAILRAAAATPRDVRVLVPLVTAPWELEALRELLEEAAAAAGVPPRPLGAMIEAPAALFALPELLAAADFVAVGTNDLFQYLGAADRDDPRVGAYASPFQPAALRALDALRRGLGEVEASVCGEMASSPLGALALLALGYRRLSVRPRAVPVVRTLARRLRAQELPPLATALLDAEDPSAVERLLRRAVREKAPVLLA
ncbi:MAG: GAF domain-containing protein [Planctomycetota bacterium]|nr:MAG: GAF domain-containing protein [Planctomycetota bacterium]